MSKSDLKILIADDDLDVRSILAEHIGEQGYQLIEAENGAEALEAALISRPDLVILDVMMPELNGWEVCKYIKQSDELNGTKVIMLTAIGHTVNQLTSPLYGADEHIDKPFDLDAIDEAMGRLLGLDD